MKNTVSILKKHVVLGLEGVSCQDRNSRTSGDRDSSYFGIENACLSATGRADNACLLHFLNDIKF